jgi:hypothetical protein
VFRTPRGYSLFQFESATEARVLTPEEAHDQIANALWEQKRRVELEKYLARLRSQATIEWKNEELRKAFESAAGNTVGSEEATLPAASPSGN